MNERESFYLNSVKDLIADKHSSILVCGGGPLDKNIFETLGFQDVTISNLDSRMNKQEYDPSKWRFENAEALSLPAELYDYVVIHAAIHHASSPHKVLTEMYRVAKKGVLAFESRDSTTMRLLEKFGIIQVYEHAAVFYNDCKFGGMNNTEIPNYVYRWTEREIEKTIQSFAPYSKPTFVYKYGTAFPSTPELENKNKLKITALKLIRPLFTLFASIFPKQQNLFAFFIVKPDIKTAHFPWLHYNKNNNVLCFNKEWGNQKYRS